MKYYGEPTAALLWIILIGSTAGVLCGQLYGSGSGLFVALIIAILYAVAQARGVKLYRDGS